MSVTATTSGCVKRERKKQMCPILRSKTASRVLPTLGQIGYSSETGKSERARGLAHGRDESIPHERRHADAPDARRLPAAACGGKKGFVPICVSTKLKQYPSLVHIFSIFHSKSIHIFRTYIYDSYI
jgi:hypothetical protein